MAIMRSMLTDAGIVRSFKAMRKRLLHSDPLLVKMIHESSSLGAELSESQTHGIQRAQRFYQAPGFESISDIRAIFSEYEMGILIELWHQSDQRMKDFIGETMTRSFQTRHFYIVPPEVETSTQQRSVEEIQESDTIESPLKRTRNDCCAICLGDFEGCKLAETPCKHIFHPKCLGKVLLTPTKTFCPLCRAHLPPPEEPQKEFAV